MCVGTKKINIDPAEIAEIVKTVKEVKEAVDEIRGKDKEWEDKISDPTPPEPPPKPPVEEGKEEEPEPPTPPGPKPEPQPKPGPVPPIAEDFSNVTWLHTNVSSWKVTSVLKSVRITSSHIILDYDKANVWPGRNIQGISLNANPWIFVYRNNNWYAATWEWMRPGQTAKSINSVKGDHIKQAPLQSFSPVKGEVYGFMVSGLARSSARNVQERTNIVMVRW